MRLQAVSQKGAAFLKSEAIGIYPGRRQTAC